MRTWAIVSVAASTIVLVAMLFRYDTQVLNAGTTVLTDRFTGSVQYCRVGRGCFPMGDVPPPLPDERFAEYPTEVAACLRRQIRPPGEYNSNAGDICNALPPDIQAAVNASSPANSAP